MLAPVFCAICSMWFPTITFHSTTNWFLHPVTLKLVTCKPESQESSAVLCCSGGFLAPSVAWCRRWSLPCPAETAFLPWPNQQSIYQKCLELYCLIQLCGLLVWSRNEHQGTAVSAHSIYQGWNKETSVPENLSIGKRTHGCFRGQTASCFLPSQSSGDVQNNIRKKKGKKKKEGKNQQQK